MRPHLIRRIAATVRRRDDDRRLGPPCCESCSVTGVPMMTVPFDGDWWQLCARCAEVAAVPGCSRLGLVAMGQFRARCREEVRQDRRRWRRR